MASIEQTAIKVKNSSGDFVSINPFPVGFIYMSLGSTSPADLYGGTWTEYSDQRFWLPEGTSGYTWGNTDLTVYLPWGGMHVLSYESSTLVLASGTQGASKRVLMAANTSNADTNYTTFTGDDIWPNYRTCYCWVRTA